MRLFCLSSGNIYIINRVSQAIPIQIPALGVVEGSVGRDYRVRAQEAVEGGVVVAGAEVVKGRFSILLLARELKLGIEGVNPGLLHSAIGVMGRSIGNVSGIISHNSGRANLVGGVVIILASLRLVPSHHLRPYVWSGIPTDKSQYQLINYLGKKYFQPSILFFVTFLFS